PPNSRTGRRKRLCEEAVHPGLRDVEEGEVEMDINYALEPDELERGLVLSCQSFPKTDKVKLSFDV
ncbi:MAG: hypothetical protein HRT61_19805, partial [Ekhidna sp.]|nr:hypothetical protein [Ekhidna sp.]